MSHQNLSPKWCRTIREYFKETKLTKVVVLRRGRVLDIVNWRDVPDNSNIVGGCFVLTLKSFFRFNEAATVQYIAQVYADDINDLLADDLNDLLADYLNDQLAVDTNQLRSTSLRMSLKVAAVLSFTLFSHNVKQAYLWQKTLTRTVYFRWRPEERHLLGISAKKSFWNYVNRCGVCATWEIIGTCPLKTIWSTI